MYNVVLVKEKLWVSPWFISHVKNVKCGAYDECGHFNCHIVEARFSMPRFCTCQKMIQELDQKYK